MKRLIYIISFVAIGLNSNAQQLPQYSQYLFNQYAINPAVAGTKPYYDVRSNNRYQWIGITDAPRTYTISLNGPSKNQKMGFGGLIYTDIVGPTRRIGGQISYAYNIKITEKIKTSFGVSAGLSQWLVDGSKINLNNNNDAVLSGGLQSAIVPDAKFGIYVYEGTKWYFGVSAPNLLQSKLFFFNYQAQTLSQLEDHYFVNGAYKFDLGEDFQLEPSFMVKYVRPAPLKIDATVRAIYKNTIWLGGGFRTNDAFFGMIGYMHKNNLSIGYSYDFTSTNLKHYSAGTHELMLGIKFVRVEQREDNGGEKSSLE